MLVELDASLWSSWILDDASSTCVVGSAAAPGIFVRELNDSAVSA